MLTMRRGQERPVRQSIDSNASDDAKIICDPFFNSKQDEKILNYVNCYDVVVLGQIPKGEWALELTLERVQDEWYLVLRGDESKSRGEPLEEHYLLQVDRGKNNVIAERCERGGGQASKRSKRSWTITYLSK